MHTGGLPRESVVVLCTVSRVRIVMWTVEVKNPMYEYVLRMFERTTALDGNGISTMAHLLSAPGAMLKASLLET